MVGSALLRQLASDLPYHKLVLLTRHPERTAPRCATAVFADIAVPRLGLNATTERLLQARGELFFHCAADTRFNLPLDLARRVNTHGTQQVLNLARACRNLRHFAHISTLYVAGRREGVVPEQPLRHRAGYVNSYEASKHEAEALVLSESAAMPVGIYRLSSVIDLSRNDGHFRQVIRFAALSKHFPFFPADRSVLVDLIDSVWAARAVSTLVAQHGANGCIRHICAGERNARSVGTLFDRALAACNLPASNRGSALTLVPLAEFERLRSSLHFESRVSRALEHLMTFVPHLSLYQPFDCRVTSALLAQSGVPSPATDSMVSAVLTQEFSRHGD
jgi:nucleoside-diphosphate-sugar epimerase